VSRFQPGQSGNPAGRPPKTRAFADLLKGQALKASTLKGRDQLSNQELWAELVWEAILSGRIKFPGTNRYKSLDMRTWVMLVKLLCDHVDGPPKLDVELFGQGDDAEDVSMEAVVAARQRVDEWRRQRRAEEYAEQS
jgi:hypothetical protein